MRPEVRHFVAKLFLLLAPALVYVLVFAGVPFWSGELQDLDDVVKAQADGKVWIFGRAYKDNFFPYKLKAANLNRPEILAIGSSRMMEFRFPQATRKCFYNAAGTTQYVTTVLHFLSSLERDDRPKVVIVGFDQAWFISHGGYDDSKLSAATIGAIGESGLYRGLSVSRLFLRDVAAGKINFGRLLQRTDPTTGRNSLGISAIMRGHGFRPDGSYQYGEFIRHPTPLDARLSQALSVYEDGATQFTHGSSISTDAMLGVDRLLSYASRENIEVIGLSPPFMPAVVDSMRTSGNYTYIAPAARALSEIFSRHGFRYYDFTDPRIMGGTDDSMLDASHPSEEFMSQVRDSMLKSSPELSRAFRDCRRKQPLLAKTPDITQ